MYLEETVNDIVGKSAMQKTVSGPSSICKVPGSS